MLRLMSSITLKETPTKLKEMQEHYRPYLIEKKIAYSLFFSNQDGVTITAYQSGKVLFQGDHPETEADIWQKEQSVMQEPPSGLPADFSQKSIIGSDEVGNGSYFGPLVVCAVYADKNNLKSLQKLGVKDSKLLKDSQIKLIAKKIETMVPYQLLTVRPAKYNQVQPTYNAVRMKVALHNQAIQLLLKKIAPTKPEAILIDQFTKEANYRKYLAKEAV